MSGLNRETPVTYLLGAHLSNARGHNRLVGHWSVSPHALSLYLPPRALSRSTRRHRCSIYRYCPRVATRRRNAELGQQRVLGCVVRAQCECIFSSVSRVRASRIWGLTTSIDLTSNSCTISLFRTNQMLITALISSLTWTSAVLLLMRLIIAATTKRCQRGL
jgi:hypothetical protein